MKANWASIEIKSLHRAISRSLACLELRLSRLEDEQARAVKAYLALPWYRRMWAIDPVARSPVARTEREWEIFYLRRDKTKLTKLLSDVSWAWSNRTSLIVMDSEDIKLITYYHKEPQQ